LYCSEHYFYSYYSLSVNNFYNFSFYLPPLEVQVDPGGGDPGGSGENYSTATAFTVIVVDSFTYPLSDVKVVISRYMNNTGEFEEIVSSITDGYGEIQVFLIPNVKVHVSLTKSGYVQVGDKFWTPLLDNYGNGITKTFSMEVSPDYVANKSFWEMCDFTGVMYNNGSLYVSFSDSNSETTGASFYTYEVFNVSSTLLATNTTVLSSFGFWVTGINISRVHEVVLYLNHSTLGFIVIKITVNPLRTPSEDTAEIEADLTSTLGDNPLGWVNMLFLFIPVLVLLVVFGPKNAGMGIVGSGLYIGFASLFIDVPDTLILLAPFVIAIGIILVIVKKRRENL